VSFAHVATVGASWQTAPVAAQIVELQVHAAIPPVIAHVWWLPHMAVVAHCVQPPGWVWQVCTPPEAHSVRPAVQPSVHPELPLVELAVLMDVLVPPGPALLDVELLVIALLVDVLVPVAPKPAAELLVLELPFEPPTLELEPAAAPTPPPSARVPFPIPRIESQPTRLRLTSAVRRRVAHQRPNGRITTTPAGSGRPYPHSCSTRRSPADAGRSPTS
jgi:hypothetical protein